MSASLSENVLHDVQNEVCRGKMESQSLNDHVLENRFKILAGGDAGITIWTTPNGGIVAVLEACS